jgi:hypothetical protein
MDSAIKAANKILKKADGAMKIKELAKSVADKLDGKSSTEQIKDWILASDKFSMDGKLVSLVKSSTKRKSDDVDDAKATKKAAKKAKKEAKKRKKEGSGSSAIGGETTDSTSFTDATKWRKEQKIVLKSTSDDEDGRKLSGELNKNEAYIPYTTFESDRIKTSVHEAFLKQCTVVNKFTTPSAIQSQCWPVLLHPGSDGKRRDVVGYVFCLNTVSFSFIACRLTFSPT